MKEKSLYLKIRKTGRFKNYRFFYEVPVADWTESRKSIDMVTFQNKDIIAIEVKIRDWKTALKQAFSNLFVAEQSYVALWHECIRNVEQQLFRRTGIGLLEIDGRCNEIIPAIKSRFVVPEKHNYVKCICKKKSRDFI